jgi:hypothetical protein
MSVEVTICASRKDVSISLAEAILYVAVIRRNLPRLQKPQWIPRNRPTIREQVKA